ncbi:hypothetical protein JDV02_006426 [Purpureocillium takamizusanense]|uniref:Uncharacterized protein n=1 Tax=Purpureocillium takamizusanense TaxID=2060973 RepID=A0A9Q8VC41_9HYPO|nr:uncharacterized protein JDV02_006426 [Purpureocillium takamizusanense]UNI20328.1 hypothetical protein JDV02_006426 [Purpureocillium takamizusanense]
MKAQLLLPLSLSPVVFAAGPSDASKYAAYAKLIKGSIRTEVLRQPITGICKPGKVRSVCAIPWSQVQESDHKGGEQVPIPCKDEGQKCVKGSACTVTFTVTSGKELAQTRADCPATAAGDTGHGNDAGQGNNAGQGTNAGHGNNAGHGTNTGHGQSHA